MKKMLFLILIYSNLIFSFKTWVKEYMFLSYDDYSSIDICDIVENYDSSFTIVGMVARDYGSIVLSKIDYEGNILWTRVYPTEGPAYQWEVKTMRTTNGENLLVYTGATLIHPGHPGLSAIGLVALKFDKDWNLIWRKFYGYKKGPYEYVDMGIALSSIKKDLKGGYIIIGGLDTSDNGFILKINEDGKINNLWFYNDSFGFPDIENTEDGGYLIVDQAKILEDKKCNILTFKINESGELIFSKIYKIGESEDSHCSFTTPLIFKEEEKYSIFYFFCENKICYITQIKIDEMGNVLQKKSYISNFSIMKVKKIKDGYFLFGYTYQELALLKIDFEGDIIWQKIYNERSIGSIIPSITVTKDEGLILSTYNVFGRDAIIRTNPEGSVACKNFTSKGNLEEINLDLIEQNSNVEIRKGSIYQEDLVDFGYYEESDNNTIEICKVKEIHERPF